MNDEPTLESLRSRIDEIDRRLHELLNARGRLAMDIARVKAHAGDTAFYRPEREAQILREIVARNEGPLPDAEIARLFREIMSATLALEATVRVGYLGPAGTYTQAAALKHFGHSAQAVPIGTIDEVFRDVEADEVEFGVVPVENSTEGMVTHTLDLLFDSPLRICGEVELPIHHQLLSREPSLGQVRTVLAHTQALAQCRKWLDENLPAAARSGVSSNAEAARRAASEAGVAAIASQPAAEIYGVERLASNIEDHPGNTTRFLVISKQETRPSGRDKTSLVMSSRNVPGALYRLLGPFQAHGISMTRIESRPSRRGLWEYVFFIDIEGHRLEPGVAAALEELEGEAALFKMLGSYPQAVV